ncbi:putative ribonuclease H-like domain-containing protein [Tanacetum coccineum]
MLVFLSPSLFIQRGIVIRNKARLVAQGYTQKEGIYYDSVFAPVAKIEAIRLFLAYASFKDFVVYQMDVKSAFLYDKIEEEFYVCQPPRFEDLEFLDRVYKVEKALYGLHQAPRACQDKYADKILKKFGFLTVKTASTPIETSKPLMKDENAEDVDVHLYRSMIDSLMYLTSSRPDIMFAVCACTRFQVTLKVSHLHAVKRIFRYLKGQPKLGLWYPKDSPFDLKAYTVSDYAGVSLDRKSTTGGCQFLGSRLISWQCKKKIVVANSTTEVEYVVASSCCGQVLWIQNQLLDYGYNFMNTKIFIDNESTICIVKNPVFHSKTKHIEIRHHFIKDSYEKRLIQVIKIQTDHNVADLLIKAFDVSRFQYLIARKPKRATEISQSSGPIPLVADKTVIKEWEDRMEMVAITASSLEAEHDSGSDPREVQIQALVDGKKVIVTETSVRRALHLKDAEGTDCLPTATIFAELERMGGEDRLQLNELMEIYTNLQKKVLDLETSKAAQAQEISSLKQRVKKLEKKKKLIPHGLRRLYKGMKIADLDADAEVTLIDNEDLMFDTGVLNGDEVFKEPMVNAAITTSSVPVSAADPITTTGEVVTTASVEIPNELTLAQTLIKIKSEKPKAVTTDATTVTPASTRPTQKELSFIIRRSKHLHLHQYDEEFTFKIQAEEQEEERIAREKAQKIQEVNIAWDDIEAIVEANYQLAQRLRDEEQEQYTNEEKAKFFYEFLKQRRKFFVAKRAKTKRNKPPTQAQQRKLYCNYLKNMEGYTLKQLKGFKFEVIKDMFDKAFKRVNTFLEQEVAKKQKIDDDQEEAEIKKHMEIVLDEEEIAIDAIPLATKPPMIVEYKIVKEGKIRYFQIIRANGSSKRPEEGYERVLWGDLKVMFEPDIESKVWRSLEGHNMTVWRLFNSYGVHFVRFKNLHIFILVEKRYPLTPAIITGMLNKKLQADH